MTNQIRAADQLRREKSPLEEAMEDFHILKDELESMRLSNQQLKDMNVGLLQENVLIKEMLGRIEKERDRYKSYAYELGTRLDVIAETIKGAQAYASDAALGTKKNQPEAPATLPKIKDTDVEQVSARAIIARLPVNNFERK